ncbi:uncharacterized protein KLLA0_E09945g [Kluyveromyces lactis]|uniref:KLLA0E09945p n=1 Tax=Kluyveromyces lactis (strain ATCC 8585 / CBS 2359 / DSM 70799 / NBRC 1267 / NRRL Y-1140 / WM37) TaxID=284590 RepID=Q6CNU1_KLULA|nr:uncharacterized protein KLLA0_E09945g [Kluyveromyces lactis]CAG99485.1 KLLA0E09945p [Kluyveromyces lactis]|eukprot:XP_454398.1 uncharacterized protein KLLA0_E09945g [Kluyveromyces lactis]
MSYESDDSSDGEPITHPTQVYQRIYEKEADSHLQERFALEREADAAEKEYLKVADEWKKKPTPNLEQRMNDLSDRCEEINENLNDANESWINSYSVAMYYKDKERRELEEDSD